MLRKVRVILALIFFLGITLLFLDFTGAAHGWFGWMAKIQFVPAVLAMNLIVIGLLIAVTLIFGRVYCSVVCPLGVMQDVVAWISRRPKKRKYPYNYSPALNIVRYIFLGLFVVAIAAGIGSFVALLAPYSSYGRIASNLFSPVYDMGNNVLAYFAERADSYRFYEVNVWIKSLPVFIIAAVTFAVIAVMAWRGGRTYCNTVCPVGTVLGFLSRFSLLKVRINTEKCNSCGLCSRKCKASCIDGKHHKIDYSRCVACMDCLETCRHGAISYGLKLCTVEASADKKSVADAGRRSFMAVSGALIATTALKAQEKKVDGGLAVIIDKKIPDRKTRIVPAGAISLRNFENHCTGCQLCVSGCPNGVLRPSGSLLTLMQPEMSYERGYCRPDCNRCSDVCPTGAIRPISLEDKSATQIGRAVWAPANCIPLVNGDKCGNCARHCPVGAITMTPIEGEGSPGIPVVDTERCIGCGACENLCPARPFSAIYVEGNEVHRSV